MLIKNSEGNELVKCSDECAFMIVAALVLSVLLVQAPGCAIEVSRNNAAVEQAAYNSRLRSYAQTLEEKIKEYEALK